jgi:hypothetical protein
LLELKEGLLALEDDSPLHAVMSKANAVMDQSKAFFIRCSPLWIFHVNIIIKSDMRIGSCPKKLE